MLLEDEHGPVAVYALPYLEPDAVRGPGWAASPARGHEAVLGAAMRQVRADLGARGPARGRWSLAHAFVAGGQPSDSERDISVGGVGAVPAGCSHGVDYAALGHLHGRQQLADGGPLLRFTARLLLLRARPHEGLVARRPRARRPRAGRHRRRPRPAAAGRPARPARSLLTDPRSPRTSRPGAR